MLASANSVNSVIKLGMMVGLGPGHTVLDGDLAPPPRDKGAQSPIFGPCPLRCSQTAGWIKMPLGRPMKVSIGQGDFVIWGPCSPLLDPPKKAGNNPQFSAHLYCGQTAVWNKMPFSTKVGLNQGDFVLD